MKSKIVTAVFIGQNGSCGYITNREYALKISTLTKNHNICIEIAGTGEKIVEYTNILTFLDNWSKVKVLSQ